MNQQLAKTYRAGETTAPELYFLEQNQWLYIYDLSYWYDHRINVESEVSRTKNIHGVLDIFCRIAGTSKDSLYWFAVVEKNHKGTGKWHHHLCIGPHGLESNSPYQMKLLKDCWEHLYRPKWYEDWQMRTRLIPNRERNKVLRERYEYFRHDPVTYLGKDGRSPIAFKILDANTFGGGEKSKSPYNGCGQALVKTYDKWQFWTAGAGYRCKRPRDPKTGEPLVDWQHPVYVDMSSKLFRHWKRKRQYMIPEIDY